VILSALLLAPVFAAGEAQAPVSKEFYIESAFAHNPSLEAMRERIRMKEGTVARAGALDDPKVWVGVVSVPVDSFSFREDEMTGKEIGVSQMFPFPGKRKIRTDIAQRERMEAEHDLEEMRNMLRSEIRMAHAELVSVRGQAEVVRRTRDVLRDIVGVAQEMYAVGRGSQPDVLRGQVESGRMREMVLMLENREKILEIRLNTLAALPPDRPVPPLEALGDTAPPLDREHLIEMYTESRPARRAALARIARAESQVAMARREYYPDFEASVSYMQRDPMPEGMSRPDMVSGMVMMNLPIWRRSRLDPAVREMEAERTMAARELENLDLEASNRIGSVLDTLESRTALTALYRTTLIPQAEQAFQANVEAYQVGRIDFPMLMDSVMAVLSFRRDYLAMVGDLHMEKARLEAAVGREIAWREGATRQ
jgi:outer membrane protein, heavy metal efflux system